MGDPCVIPPLSPKVILTARKQWRFLHVFTCFSANKCSISIPRCSTKESRRCPVSPSSKYNVVLWMTSLFPVLKQYLFSETPWVTLLGYGLSTPQQWSIVSRRNWCACVAWFLSGWLRLRVRGSKGWKVEMFCGFVIQDSNPCQSSYQIYHGTHVKPLFVSAGEGQKIN